MTETANLPERRWVAPDRRWIAQRLRHAHDQRTGDCSDDGAGHLFDDIASLLGLLLFDTAGDDIGGNVSRLPDDTPLSAIGVVIDELAIAQHGPRICDTPKGEC